MENSFITETMVDCMLHRWTDLGKPLYMIPRDFRDRILAGLGDRVDRGSDYNIEMPVQMQNEVRLNYLKWLQLGTEIDMFELLCIIILYTKCDLSHRLECKCSFFSFLNDHDNFFFSNL